MLDGTPYEEAAAHDRYFKRPAVRRMFKPDPGHLLCDCDLSGADAQVVAWESGDKELKDAFKAGLDVHNFNGKRIWGEAYDPKRVRRKLIWRDECKRGVHGTNYLSGVPNLAATLGWTRSEVDNFQRQWFQLNPGILDYHLRVEYNLQTRRRVDNRFGFRIIYFDRPSNILPKAVAWIPQSTVGIVCSRGAVKVHRNLPWATILLQVHDSVVFQIPFNRANSQSFKQIREHLENIVPYPDPLLIPWGIAISDKNWQEVKKTKWKELE
jgi:DNA polymerase I-like protein with 3'-5' exonuclease and polymerase domains